MKRCERTEMGKMEEKGGASRCEVLVPALWQQDDQPRCRAGRVQVPVSYPFPIGTARWG